MSGEYDYQGCLLVIACADHTSLEIFSFISLQVVIESRIFSLVDEIAPFLGSE